MAVVRNPNQIRAARVGGQRVPSVQTANLDSIPGSSSGSSNVVDPSAGEQVTPPDVPTLTNQVLFGQSGGSQGFVGASSLPQTSGPQQQSLQFLLSLLVNELGGPLGSEGLGEGFQERLGGSIPGQNPLQAMSLAGLERVALGESNVFSGAVGQESISTLIDLLNTTAQDSTDVFNRTVAGPAQEDLGRLFQELNASAVGSGNLFGSENREQKNIAGDNFLEALAAGRTQFAFDSETRARDTRLQALGLAPGIAGLDLDLGSQLFGLGTAARNEDFKTFAAELGLFQADQAREQFLLQSLLGGSVAPTFGVSGGFALGGGSSADGGVLAAFAQGLFQ